MKVVILVLVVLTVVWQVHAGPLEGGVYFIQESNWACEHGYTVSQVCKQYLTAQPTNENNEGKERSGEGAYFAPKNNALLQKWEVIPDGTAYRIRTHARKLYWQSNGDNAWLILGPGDNTDSWQIVPDKSRKNAYHIYASRSCGGKSSCSVIVSWSPHFGYYWLTTADASYEKHQVSYTFTKADK